MVMENRKAQKNHRSWITAVVADAKGNIFELEGYGAAAMAGAGPVALAVQDTGPMPHGSELMLLPDRRPLLFSLETGKPEILEENPYRPGEPVFPVAAFNAPGFVVAGVSAYREEPDARPLPLFSYGAVGWRKGKFRSAAIPVDREPRQDLRKMRIEDVKAGVVRMRKKMPENRLRAHLENCALKYGCPAGKNFFLGRYEAPLPTSRICNARCLGCISLQGETGIPVSQERITFTPSPEEIAEVALAHIFRVEHAVVSFGQGCEGDPLMAAAVIEPAIRLIRSGTDRGTINMNTNGSRPDILAGLLDAGLDSIRISMNSARPECYEAYFRPSGYGFSHVTRSIDLALGKGRYVSINYLNCPGFTDTPEEMEALCDFLKEHPVRLIQWRNLNYDPLGYWKAMKQVATHGKPVGMKALLHRIQERFPGLRFGYFNPPKERFDRMPVFPV